MLKNQAYIGKVNYKGQIYPGLWPAIIDEETWAKVQDRMESHRKERKAYRNTGCSGLLSKVLKCKACGSAMVHTYVLKKGRHKYRYYYCSNAQKRGQKECSIRYINAQVLEECVEQFLRGAIKNSKTMPNKAEAEAILSPIWNTIFFEEKRRIIRAVIQEATFDSKTNKIGLVLTGSTERLEFDSGIKRIHAPTRDGQTRQLAKEPPLRKYLMLVYHIQRLIEEGRIKHRREVCTWLGMGPSHIDRIMNMLLLSPRIQASILNDDSPAIQALNEYTIRDITSEPLWEKQEALWQNLLSNPS